MSIRGGRGTLRISPSGDIHLNDERLPFEPPTCGYKGDSVHATQQHLIHCLLSGRPAESEGRSYLATAALVEDCYRIAQSFGEPSALHGPR